MILDSVYEAEIDDPLNLLFTGSFLGEKKKQEKIKKKMAENEGGGGGM